MRKTGRKTRGHGPESSPWSETDNWLVERRTDLEYVGRKAGCCGCHPDVHDELVGCLLCGCDHGIDRMAEGRIWEEEIQVLVRGATIDLAMRTSRMLGIRWRVDYSNGHRYLTPRQWRRMARQLRAQARLRESLGLTRGAA